MSESSATPSSVTVKKAIAVNLFTISPANASKTSSKLTLVNIGAQTVKGRMQLRRLNKLVTSNKHKEALEQCTKIKSLFDIRSLSFSPLKELSDNHREDEISTALLPEDYWSDRAAKTTGDGNCMFNAVSLALFSTEDVSLLLRLLTAVELYDDADYYATHPAMETHFFSALSRLSDKEEMELSRVEAIKREVKLKVSVENKRSAFICLVALSRILGVEIKSIFPDVHNRDRALFHQHLIPSDVLGPTIKILWSGSSSCETGFVADHIVPVI